MSQKPKHLEDFNAVERLDLWRHSGVTLSRRSWTIRSFGVKDYSVMLDWVFDNQLATIQRVATTIEEAAWLAIREFDSHVRHAARKVHDNELGEAGA